MASALVEDDYELLAAIDFGTTFSGYAYSFKDSPNDIILNQEWGHEFGAHSYKTPTCVLTEKPDPAKPDQKLNFVAFGYDALNRFTSDVEKKYDLFDRFKMALYKEKVISSKTTVISRGGNLHPAETIITLSLKYLYDHFKRQLEKSEGDIDLSVIKWVITVPAIWSEGAKQLMRRAAVKAGIIDKNDSKKLLLALEPEAASFWCRNLPRNRLSKTKTAERSLKPGTAYMVVDCGGGTTDITVHEIVEGGNIKEVHRANGGDWGGVKIDEEFIKLLDKILGSKITSEFKKQFPSNWFEMLVQFETKKRAYNPEYCTPVNISFSFAFGKSALKTNAQPLDDIIRSADIQGVSWLNEQLVLQPEQMNKLFAPVVSKITDHIQQLLTLSNIQPTSHIFLVGGLNNSPVLTSEIHKKFGKDRTIIIPPDAGACVLKGATRFGHLPTEVVSRIARKTYGQSVHSAFVAEIHDPSHKINIDGKERCDSVFKVWVRKGESIKVGECRTFKVHPRNQSTTLSHTYIYSVDMENVKYVDDDGVVKVGSITLNTPDVDIPWAKRDIKHHVYFGGTELHIRSEDIARNDGDTGELTIDFLAE